MFTVVLIGRTNVGKSTLFNRILGRTKAITSELAHTTRDRNVGETGWRGIQLRLIDTGGVERLPMNTQVSRAQNATIEDEIRLQVERAITDADLLLFVVDTREGMLPGEKAIARRLRSLSIPVHVVCNKSETAKLRAACHEFTALGFGDPVPVAAATGMGVGDLLDDIVAIAKQSIEEDAPTNDERAEPPTRIAIVGEPNVGKSSLVNTILNREEVIVRPEAFTTRDIHDVDIDVDGRHIVLLDTAGIRRAAIRTRKIVRRRLEHIEQHAAGQSLAAIRRSDVVCLVLDATRPATKHTKQLASAIVDARRACVIILNKIDLLEGALDIAATTQTVHAQFPHLAWAPVVPTSAVKRIGTDKILRTAFAAQSSWERELSEADLVVIYRAIRARIPQPSSRVSSRKIRTIELRQAKTRPPTFILRTHRRVRLPPAIPGIVERAIRDHADFTGSPIVLMVKGIRV